MSFIRHPEFRRGFHDMVAPSLGIAAWGLVTGVAMVKSGMSVAAALAMTLLVYAGSAQLAALPLVVAGAPLWVLWATAFCVNLRFVIYSAHWRKYFGTLPRWQRIVLGYFAVDLSYVAAARKARQFIRSVRAMRVANRTSAVAMGSAAVVMAAR